MTGQPIQAQPQPQPQGTATGYDPMTGQPIQPQKTVTGYDPMTGQPIYAGTNATFTAAPAAKTGIGIGAKIAIAAAVVVVAGGAILTGVKAGAFSGPAGKVERAVNNTFSDGPEIIEALSAASITDSKSYTLGMDVSYMGQKVSGEYRYSEKKQQLEATVDFTGATELTAYVTLDTEALYMAVPNALDDTLVYYYTKDNDGALIDAMGEDTVEQINSLLSGVDNSDGQAEFAEAIQKELDSLKYEKISAETFEVDGKDRKCKGYATTIEADNINNILDAYMEYIESSMPAALRQNMDWSEFEDLEDELDDMDDLDVSFFIYKNKLACIRMDGGDDTVEIQFQGGDYRLQNVEVLVNDDTYMKLEGEKDGSTETIKLKAAGETVLKVEYDTKSGDFEIKADSETIKGNIESSRKGVTITISEISGLDGLKLTLYAQKDADFADVDEKNLFDVGNADEDDFYDLMNDIDTDVIEDYASLLGLY
jgi:carbon monoxide dehydrogenase subunit G